MSGETSRATVADAVLTVARVLHLHVCPIANCQADCGYDYGAGPVAAGLIDMAETAPDAVRELIGALQMLVGDR